VSASPGDGKPAIGIEDLVQTFKSNLHVPKRDLTGPFMFSFDHAFQIKGQGCVLTGTVLSGAIKPGQNVEVPALGEAGKGKKVRSLQMFRQPVQNAGMGDRVAICVPGLEAKELERGILVDTKFGMPTLDACICVVNRLHYYKNEVKTKAKYHITLGHQTVMATAHFFCPLSHGASSSSSASPEEKDKKAPKKNDGNSSAVEPSLAMGLGALTAERQKSWPTSFSFDPDYLHLDELFQHGAPIEYENNDGDMVKIAPAKELGRLEFHLNGEFKRQIAELLYDPHSGRLADELNSPLGQTVDSRGVVPLKERDRVMYLLAWLAHSCDVPIAGQDPPEQEPLAYALLLLERGIQCPTGSLIIGSKLDFDAHTPNCRMAFFGRILTPMNPKEASKLRMLKMKQKTGVLDRFDKQDRTLMICQDMFTAETDMSLFTGLKVTHEATGAEGILEGAYAQSGQFKVRFKEELPVKSDPKTGHVKADERIALFFKKYDFDNSKKIQQ